MLALLGGVGRGAVVAAWRVLAPLQTLLGWAPSRAAIGFVGSALEVSVEYALYSVGWILWIADWIPRAPALVSFLAGSRPPGRILVHGVVLDEPGPGAGAALLAGDRILSEASRILERHGLSLRATGWSVLPLGARGGAPLPGCGPSALLRRPFTWLSARAPVRAPVLTVFFAPDLRAIAGCAFPGADWILVDLKTDGTTVVHELGHLADLWSHSPDPANVMTDRPGGSHDRFTTRQLALLRTCRFVGAAPRPKRWTPEVEPRPPV